MRWTLLGREWDRLLRRRPNAIRTVEVLPPSERNEESSVLITASFIVLCVVYIVAFERYGGPWSRADAPPALVQHALAALFRWQERMAANPRFAALDRKANLPAAAWFPYHVAAAKELGIPQPERPSQ